MYGWIQYQKAKIRSEVKHQLMDELGEAELEVLTFTTEEASELYWEHDKEFEYKDQMYDVVEERRSDGYVTYVCWPDHKESHLNKMLDQLATSANQNNQEQDKSNQQLLTFFKSLYCSQISISQQTIGQINVLPTGMRAELYNDIYLETLSPPPRPSSAIS